MIAKENKLLLIIATINAASLCALFAIKPQLCTIHLIKIIISSFSIIIMKNLMPTIWMQLTEIGYYSINILLLVNLFNKSVNIKRWVKLFGVFIQLSEFAKILLILMLAKYLSENKMNLKTIIICAIITIIPAFLITKQPNLGTGIVCMGIGAGMIFLKKIDRKIILTTIALTCCAMPFFWQKMLPYQKARIVSFLNPTSDPKGQSYQTIQSIIAIGSGGFCGSNATQNKLGFVPENHTDFLFSNFAEHFGFIFSILLLILMFAGILLVIQIGITIQNEFQKFFCLGFAILWFIETTMNLGMNTGLLPVTGIALPFFSFGGSSMLSFFIGTAIIINIIKNNKVHL